MTKSSTGIWQAAAGVVVLVLAAAAQAGEAPPAEAPAGPDLSQTTTSQIESQAELMVRAQNFAEALPYLEELIRRLSATEDPTVLNRLGGLRYYLGVARMTNRLYGPAAEALKEFLEKHPQHDFAREGLELMADALRADAAFQPAAEAYEKLLTNTDIRGNDRVLIQARMADCFVQLKDWPKAVPALEAVLMGTTDPELRGDAAKSLAQGYVETDQAERIFRLLDVLSAKGSKARTDVQFNLNILASADKMMGEGKFGLALYMYQLVLPTEELVRRCKENQQELLALRDRLIKERAAFKRILTVIERVAALEAQEKTIAEAQPYTVELRLRIAKAYFEMGRKWEAMWGFVRIWEQFPDHPLAEQALSGAFALAGELTLLDRAIKYGEAYLAKFPEGESKDQIGLEIGKAYTAAGESQKAIDHYNKTVEANPQHKFADQMIFLAGYNYFMTEQFPKAIESFERVKKDFPESEPAKDCMYWRAMALLFSEKYAEAHQAFAEFAEQQKGSHYVEDARFRIAACAYGLLKFDESKEILLKFLKDFPASRLHGEALILLGDIAGAQGRLADASEYFKQVERYTNDMKHVNYAAFQVGKIQELQSDYAAMERWFQRYLDTYSLKGNYTEAIWRIGFARKNLNRPEGMLDIYLDALKKYGNDPNAIGVDLILAEWPREYLGIHGKLPEKEMRDELATARALKQRTRELRWLMAFHRHELIKDDEVRYAAEDIPLSSPAVLVWAGQLAAKRREPALAEAAFQRVVDEYGATEWVETALLQLAEIRATEGKTDAALALFDRIVKTVPTSPTAGIAKKRIGDLLFDKKDYEAASKNFEQILEIKEWRGALWPESLFKVGECLLAQGKLREAFAYYQRVYVLYQHHAKWTALAYLRSATVSEKLGVKSDAIAQLKELLAIEDLKDTPEYLEAKARLEKLQ